MTPGRGKAWLRRLVTCAAAGVFVVGCSASPEVTPDPGPTSSAARAADLEREYLQRLGECLTEAGFPATMQDDGGLLVDDGPGDQQASFDAAAESCREQVGEPEVVELDEAELGTLYDLQVEAGRCLEEAGFPAEEMPSRETWVAQYAAAVRPEGAGPAPITPWDGLSLRDAEKACHYPTLDDVRDRLGASDG